MPGDLSSKNKAFHAAFRRGYERRQAGLGRDFIDHDYPDKRGRYRNSNTFSRAFRNYWRAGFETADKAIKETLTEGDAMSETYESLQHRFQYHPQRNDETIERHAKVRA